MFEYCEKSIQYSNYGFRYANIYRQSGPFVFQFTNKSPVVGLRYMRVWDQSGLFCWVIRRVDFYVFHFANKSHMCGLWYTRVSDQSGLSVDLKEQVHLLDFNTHVFIIRVDFFVSNLRTFLNERLKYVHIYCQSGPFVFQFTNKSQVVGLRYMRVWDQSGLFCWVIRRVDFYIFPPICE